MKGREELKPKFNQWSTKPQNPYLNDESPKLKDDLALHFRDKNAEERKNADEEEEEEEETCYLRKRKK